MDDLDILGKCKPLSRQLEVYVYEGGGLGLAVDAPRLTTGWTFS